MSDYLSPEQAAEEVPRFKAEWFREQLRAGKLRGSKVGGRWVIERSAIDEMVQAGSNVQDRTEAAKRRRRRRAA